MVWENNSPKCLQHSITEHETNNTTNTVMSFTKSLNSWKRLDLIIHSDRKGSPLLCLTFEASDVETEEHEEADDGHGGGTLN